MNKSFLNFFWFALILSVALPLQAQSGCDDSPEILRLFLRLSAQRVRYFLRFVLG
jgi:hypothetical protein